MKKLFLLLALFPLFCLAQTTKENKQCNLQGLVQYVYDRYDNKKVDIGAEIGIISANSVKDLDINAWDLYEKLAYKQNMFNVIDREIGTQVSETVMRNMSEYSLADQQKLKEIDDKCRNQFNYAEENFDYIGLVDASGKYSITIPYGEYYVFVKSKNTQRPTLTEMQGRILVKKIEINRPAKILSFDFEDFIYQ